MNKSILITGGAGFIGSHVVRLFVNKYPKYKIVNLDNLTYAGNLENLIDIEIKEKEGKHVEIYELRINKADFGKVIGKNGKNIDAIRLLLRAYSAKFGKRVILEIIE